MAASSAPTTNSPYKMMAFALLLLLCNGAMAQEDEAEAPTPALAEGYVRGDMIPRTTVAPDTGDSQEQVQVLPSLEPTDNNESTPGAAVTEAAPEEAGGKGTDFTVQVLTDKPTVVEPPARGDGIPQPVPQDDVVCVSKEAVQDKNAVSLKLRAVSNCEDTKMRIQSVLKELCGEDCKLQLYQEDNTDEILVSGQYVEADVGGMANKFDNDNIKDKTNVEEAVPRWGKNSKLVLVSLLLAGLLLAALLVAGYYLKTHRKNSKGVRLAESFQVDEENQANTLVSVAPLPQEPLDKPTANGESPPENGTNPAPTPAPAPTTNGHSATQTPVADTEM
ncbi:hematopoietic progenitor cell antigen CD34 [Sphaeramia orbicularis]|uniref:Hematopoietic progenitor cell antigen CD34-like n=1 Tax=Sphaeramia orbicularis TaxID=375764 RepID=A0A673A4A4_9TELE|nr:hematopoietic progenitor cell antigen CD34-like [Sphaeramia orbicularis]